MMRDILFRGKQVDTNEWVWGYYFRRIDVINDRLVNSIYTSSGLTIEVDPSTVSQFTGSRDRDDTRIFVGDITEGRYGYIAKVVWTDRGFERSGINGYSCMNAQDQTVIGNQWDNPEILEAAAL